MGERSKRIISLVGRGEVLYGSGLWKRTNREHLHRGQPSVYGPANGPTSYQIAGYTGIANITLPASRFVTAIVGYTSNFIANIYISPF